MPRRNVACRVAARRAAPRWNVVRCEAWCRALRCNGSQRAALCRIHCAKDLPAAGPGPGLLRTAGTAGAVGSSAGPGVLGCNAARVAPLRSSLQPAGCCGVTAGRAAKGMGVRVRGRAMLAIVPHMSHITSLALRVTSAPRCGVWRQAMRRCRNGLRGVATDCALWRNACAVQRTCHASRSGKLGVACWRSPLAETAAESLCLLTQHAFAV
jgi:hypothetical protein